MIFQHHILLFRKEQEFWPVPVKACNPTLAFFWSVVRAVAWPYNNLRLFLLHLFHIYQNHRYVNIYRCWSYDKRGIFSCMFYSANYFCSSFFMIYSEFNITITSWKWFAGASPCKINLRVNTCVNYEIKVFLRLFRKFQKVFLCYCCCSGIFESH